MKNLKINNVIYSLLLASIFFIRMKAETNPADLDRTFGANSNGIVKIDFGGTDIGRGGLVIDDQGRIVVSGDTTAGSDPRNFAIARLF